MHAAPSHATWSASEPLDASNTMRATVRMKRNAALSIQIPADLKTALERMADDEDRSLAYIVARILHQYVTISADERRQVSAAYKRAVENTKSRK